MTILNLSNCSYLYLAVDKSGRLVVCDSDNHGIRLFQLDSTICCKLGNQARFNFPVFVAVLSDGKFAVTQFGGHNVQLLGCEDTVPLEFLIS